MKTKEEMRKELNQFYCASADQKHVTSWSDFARLVGIPYSTIYRIVNDKMPFTQTMYNRIQSQLALQGVVIEGSTAAITTASNTAQNVSAPVTQTTTDDRWFELVAKKDEQIDRLLGIIENMHN